MNNPNKSNLLSMAVAGLGGAALSASIFWLNSPETGVEAGAAESAQQPLYWVAPMDANFRRDKPGKSPMGMDLIPVYEEANGEESEVGAVKISPAVINNLGVRTAKVEKRMMASQISTVGYVKYDEDQLVHIHPRVDGWVEQLFVKAAGDPIEQGQPLYTLYSPQLVNAQEEFLIALKRNNQALIAAAKQRMQSLQLTPKFIEQLERSEKVQSSITFYSPQQGVIDGLKIREGFYVQPGTTLMSIGKLDRVWVEAEVFERDTSQIRVGLPVTMRLDYLPGKTWQGQVEYVYPTLNDTTRTLRVRLAFDNPDQQLKPNMFAQVVINAQPSEETIVVPKEAVIRTGKQDRVVLSLGQGRFKSIAVQIGRVGATSIEVLEGLNEEDEIVVSAQFLIDSESSKASDFKRMEETSEPDSVWAAGEVNQVSTSARTVNISHEAVDAWDWPEMTMDFVVADDVEFERLSVGQSLHFEMTKTDDGQYQLTAIHIMSEKAQEPARATVAGVINTINYDTRTANISREGIEKWGRGPATMDFKFAQGVTISSLKPEDNIVFTFEVADDFIIVDYVLEQDNSSETQDTGGESHVHHEMD